MSVWRSRRESRHVVAQAALLAALPISAAHAQARLYAWSGGMNVDAYGYAVGSVRDVDGDGYDDVLVGAPQLEWSPGRTFGPGYVEIRSGQSGIRLRTLRGALPGDTFGAGLTAIGDVDRDGRGDLVVGAPQWGFASPGYIVAFSGRDGSVLWSELGPLADGDFGSALASLGDVDGDGIDDLAVGEAQAAGRAGSVLVYGGAGQAGRGRLLWSATGSGALGLLGAAVAGPGDVNGDGTPDVIAGSPAYASITGSVVGALVALSGTDGSELWRAPGIASATDFGYSVAAVGDLDGDGVADLAAGLPRAAAVRLISGASGSLLREIVDARPFSGFGWSVTGLGDWNGDGVPDYAVGAPDGAAGGGAVAVLSGADDASLGWWLGRGNDDFGLSLAGLGDVDGDARLDLAVGAPWFFTTTQAPGRSEVLSGPRVLGGSVEPFLSAIPLAFAAASGGTQTFSLRAGRAYAGLAYLMLGSVSGTSPGTPFASAVIPLNYDAWTATTLALAGTPLLPGFAGVLDAAGAATAALSLPPLPGLQGLVFWHAFVALDNGEVRVVSNAVSLTLL